MYGPVRIIETKLELCGAGKICEEGTIAAARDVKKVASCRVERITKNTCWTLI